MTKLQTVASDESIEMGESRLANFIIGGTEKAGTTSVFDYLCAHPRVCGSVIKETDFFRKRYSGDLERDTKYYGSFFSKCKNDAAVMMEASPGYLGEAEKVAPRIRALIPGVKLLFILRNPTERLYSSYHFHRGKLNIPDFMSFEDYIDRCLKFDSGKSSAVDLKLDEWYLKVLRYGRYADFLTIYRQALPADHVKIMFFENLRGDPHSFMCELSEFLKIPTEFWERFVFGKSNATFSGRYNRLHRLAIQMNEWCEPVLRSKPKIKRAIVKAYKTVNQKREGYEPMSAAALCALTEYYATSVAALRDMAGVTVPECWTATFRC